MILKIVLLYIAVVYVSAAPSTDVVPLEKRQPTVIPIVEQSEELEPNGTLKYSYETGNGIKREEISFDKVLPRTRSAATSGNETEEENDENNVIHVQQGSYSYTAPDGTVISIRYIADENGFQAFGDHLPKPPSILIASSPTRVSGRKAKTNDNAEGSSALIAAIASVPETLELSSKIAELSSAVQPLTSVIESSQNTPTSTQESPSTTDVTSTTEPPASTTESVSTTTEQTSTGVTFTEQPTTTEAVSTPEATSKPSAPEESASTAATSTPNATSSESSPSSEVTMEAATSTTPSA